MLQTLIIGTVGPVPIQKNRLLPIQSTVDRMWFRISTKICSNCSTSCTILVTFGPETSEFMLLTIAPFVAIRQKSAKYLNMFWIYLHLLYRFGRRISGDDFPSIRLAVTQGTLLWQPVKYGRRLQTSRGTTFTLLQHFTTN